jgi:hypothetical protein
VSVCPRPTPPTVLPFLAPSRRGSPTLRELLERFAEEHDILFIPKAGRQERGLQVFAFGRVSVIVDNAKEEIFAQEGGKWVRDPPLHSGAESAIGRAAREDLGRPTHPASLRADSFMKKRCCRFC